MVKFFQPRSGVIEVDFSGEPSFDLSTHGLDITFGLITRAIKSTSILVDDGGDPGSVLRYLVDTVTAAGFKVQMESALENSFQAMRDEFGQIQDIRNVKAKPIPFPREQTLGIARPLLGHQLKAVRHGLSVLNPANFSVPGSGKTTVALSTFAALVAAGKEGGGERVSSEGRGGKTRA
jgi:hypothetical protein